VVRPVRSSQVPHMKDEERVSGLILLDFEGLLLQEVHWVLNACDR